MQGTALNIKPIMQHIVTEEIFLALIIYIFMKNFILSFLIKKIKLPKEKALGYQDSHTIKIIRHSLFSQIKVT